MRDRSQLKIRPVTEQDLNAVDNIFRKALGTFHGLPDPMDFSGDSSVIRCRMLEYPGNAIAAEKDGQVVGSNFISQWGSFGLFGPLTVHPSQWRQGIGRSLLDATMERFEALGANHLGIFTFPTPAHLELYRRYGYYPQYVSLILTKKVNPDGDHPPVNLYSQLPPTEKDAVRAEARRLTDSIFSGLDLTREIQAVDQHNLGENVLLWDDAGLKAFAVCHAGPGSEAESGVLYVKFGAAVDGDNFLRLAMACESLAADRGLSTVLTGINTSRSAAYGILANHGYRIILGGLAMQSPNRPGFNRPDVYVMDDWR